MPAIRLMFMYYLLSNFDKVVKKVFFLLVYIFIFLVAFELYHDGIQGVIAHRNPLLLFKRVYHILKWYYYNKEALTFFKVVKLSVFLGFIFWLQSYIWKLNWRGLPVIVLKTVFRSSIASNILRRFGFNGDPSSFRDEGDDDDPTGITRKKDEVAERIKIHIEQAILDVLDCDHNDLVGNGVSRINRLTMVKIGYEVEELIKDVVDLRISSDAEESS